MHKNANTPKESIKKIKTDSRSSANNAEISQNPLKDTKFSVQRALKFLKRLIQVKSSLDTSQLKQLR